MKRVDEMTDEELEAIYGKRDGEVQRALAKLPPGFLEELIAELEETVGEKPNSSPLSPSVEEVNQAFDALTPEQRKKLEQDLSE